MRCRRPIQRTTERDWRRIARLMLELYDIQEEHDRIRKELGMEVVMMRERGIEPARSHQRKRRKRKG